jgi:hypothetical protein
MGRVARSLNRLGLEHMRAYLAKLRAHETPSVPAELLEDPAYSHELPFDIIIEPRLFKDRLAVGRYLMECLAPLGAEITDRDAGLWAWLSLNFFDQICPPKDDGTRRPGRDYRHIPEFGYRHRHRHLLLGPYQIYRRHGVRSILLLAGPVHSESSIYHEIASRQDLIANRGVLDAAVLLYLDPKRARPKPGAQGSLRRAGTVRRFVRVLQQLDVTYDIYGLTGKQILELLPEEFDIWKAPKEIELMPAAQRTGAETSPPP